MHKQHSTNVDASTQPYVFFFFFGLSQRQKKKEKKKFTKSLEKQKNLVKHN